jgi:hypothetical protein
MPSGGVPGDLPGASSTALRGLFIAAATVRPSGRSRLSSNALAPLGSDLSACRSPALHRATGVPIGARRNEVMGYVWPNRMGTNAQSTVAAVTPALGPSPRSGMTGPTTVAVRAPEQDTDRRSGQARSGTADAENFRCPGPGPHMRQDMSLVMTRQPHMRAKATRTAHRPS